MKISRIYCPTATSLTSDFFPDTPTAGHFSTKTVHGTGRVLALSILMEIDELIIVFIWLFVKGKDFSTHCFFSPVKIDGKLQILRCFFTFFFSQIFGNLLKFKDF